jgi:hypothetical protein
VGRFQRALFLPLIALTILAVACQPNAAPATQPANKPQVGGTLRVAISGDLLTLDPHLSSSSFDRQLYQSVFDTTNDTTMVPLQHRAEVSVMSPKLQGFSHMPNGMTRFARISLTK